MIVYTMDLQLCFHVLHRITADHCIADSLLIGQYFHNLRHTCASWLVRDGAPMAHIKDLLGYTYIKTTGAYTQIPTKELRKAAELLTLPPIDDGDSRQP